MNHTLRSIYKSLLLVSVFLCLCVPARSAAPPSDFKVRAFYLAFSRSEVQDIVSYCTSLGIEVIPLQNCFGHCEYILRHDRYAHLREDSKEVSQVCPLKIEEAKKVFREIFREVAELHPSPYFHIGADETYLLGSCAQCSQVNKSRLFVDYIKAMCEVVKEMGKKPIIWADIILMHPEAVQELPKDLIYVDWNYGWEPDRFGKLDNLLKLGVKMWGAASLRSAPDNTYLTQWMKHFNNLATFLPFARAHGYEGMIETSWSTSGTYGFHYDNGWEFIRSDSCRNFHKRVCTATLWAVGGRSANLSQLFPASPRVSPSRKGC